MRGQDGGEQKDGEAVDDMDWAELVRQLRFSACMARLLFEGKCIRNDQMLTVLHQLTGSCMRR